MGLGPDSALCSGQGLAAVPVLSSSATVAMKRDQISEWAKSAFGPERGWNRRIIELEAEFAITPASWDEQRANLRRQIDELKCYLASEE